MNITEPSFDGTEIELLQQCLDSKWVTQGAMAVRFERLIAEAQGARHAVACTSATAALHLATLALGLGPGDEVIVPALTWITSANAAEYVGARTVFADVDLATYNLDPSRVEEAVTPRTRAIVAVHLFGLAAPMRELRSIADRHGLAIIEDAACAIATTYEGRPVGTIGDVGCFSFHPRKVVTTGEGGAATTDSDDLAAKLRSLRNHGAGGPPDGEAPGPWTMARFDVLGYNYRLSDVQAAIGVAQMAKLASLVADRRRCAARYDAALRDHDDLALPDGGDKAGHTYQSYVVRLTDGGPARRNRVMTALAERNIQTRPGTHAVHRLGYYRDRYGLSPEECPNAASAEDTTITLPIVPYMREAEQDGVVECLVSALRG